MVIVARLLIYVLYAFIIVLFVRVLISWISPAPSSYGRRPAGGLIATAARISFQITEPVLAPVRRWIPPVSGLDLSPLVVWLVAYFLIAALRSF